MLDQLISLEQVIFYIGAYVTLFALHSIIIIKPYQTPSNHIEHFALHYIIIEPYQTLSKHIEHFLNSNCKLVKRYRTISNTFLNNFSLFYSDGDRQKVAQMAAKERYIVLEMGVSEAKRKEKIQMEKTMLMMIQKVE